MGSGAVGSRARLLYAAMLVGTGVIPKENLVALFPQGMSKSNPHATSENRQPLGQMMEGYLKSCREMDGVPIHSKALGWGTLEDVLNVYAMGRELGYVRAHVHFVSDPVHIKRVRLIWEKTCPRWWTADFHGATFHHMTWKERWLREPFARLVYWFRLRNFRR